MTTSPLIDETPKPEAPKYRLEFEPDGRPWTARENLTDILQRELLGPSKGDEEVISVPPDTMYLVGRISPYLLTATEGTAPAQNDTRDAEPPVDELEATEGRGVPVEGADEATVAADDDSTEDQPQQRGVMSPASMGLRFQVPAGLDAVTVTASWGVYEPVTSDEATSTGRKVTRYQRTPVSVPVRVRLADLTVGVTRDYPLRDDVVVRVDRYNDTALNRVLIEVALCNNRETPRRIPVNAWMFQTRIEVSAGGADVFLPAADVLADTRFEPDDELRRLKLQYRDRLEFAIGRTCSADWAVAPGARRATAVWTTWLPTSETPQTRAEEIGDALLDMTRLAAASPAELEAGLQPIVTAYTAWLDSQTVAVGSLPSHLQSEALEAIEEATQARDQLAAGLAFLIGDPEARRCFAFMNRVMADQRIQSQVAELRAKDPRLGRAEARARVLAKGPGAHSWRTFQLAFILMQLRSLTEPDAPRRSGDLAKVELLFFPTGGGKTEAYLGLAAYTFAIRRRQGVVDTPDGPLDGSSGVAVLMRYTLRLLTSQQFQRATALVCAAELARLEDPATWGSEPFRIGLWVGTDVSPKRFNEAVEQLKSVHAGFGHRLTVLQVQRCPWCGTRIGSANVRAEELDRRVHVYCGDDLAECPFSEGGTAGEGLPILTVDEEIYRLAPSFVIATVDKFARLAREGEAASLFGYVRKRCERHGYVHEDYRQCDIKDGSRHQARNGAPAAAVRTVSRLRPPDLIIQDELHLITGALGTTVGLFEMAIDVMSSWRTASGSTVKPLIVASTATARNAADQVRGLYGRGASIFPPQVLDAADTFFAREVPVSEENPGRRYLGICPTGERISAAEIRLAEVLLAAGQLLLDTSGAAADPYLTLVGYFNAVRELAGMARYIVDDVQTAIAQRLPWTDFPRRFGTDYGNLNVTELTSRVSSSDIGTTLDSMAVPFDPDFDSTESRRRIGELIWAKQPVPQRETNPFDVVLATSMLQVGVDVSRLGLMLVVGQPKNTAEYIQATSRVGRDAARPGLVVTLANWARPRDLVHFEQFRHYHETFYAQVEPLSVTPYSITAIERGLDAVLVSAARVLHAHQVDGLSPERNAGRIADRYGAVEQMIDTLVARALRASDEASAKLTEERLRNRLDHWVKRRQWLADRGKALVYERSKDESAHGPLMVSAEAAWLSDGSSDAAPFVVANSMREVQPEINLLVSPKQENLFIPDPPGTPRWSLPTDEETS